MANGASRIFGIIKNTADENKTTSELATLVVKSLDPLIFRLDEKTDITEDFYELDVNFDSTGMQVGDIVKALVLNDGQLYYILSNIDISTEIAILNNNKVDKNPVTQNNIDADTCLASGFYYLGTGCTNVPSSYVKLIVAGGNKTNDIAQIAISISNETMWLRTRNGDTWSNWIPVLTQNNGIYKYYLGTDIDLNDIKTAGEYGIYGTNTNSPTTSIAVLKVEVYSADWIIQTVTTIGATTTSWQRCFYNGNTWSAWKDVTVVTSGTWAPALNTIEGVAPTYTTTSSRGSYKKIGDMVFISFFIRGTITALNGADNYAVLKGLPFASKEMSLGENALSVGDCYNCVTTTNEVHYAVYNNVIRIQTSRGSSATKWQVTPSEQYFIIAGSGWYEIA